MIENQDGKIKKKKAKKLKNTSKKFFQRTGDNFSSEEKMVEFRNIKSQAGSNLMTVKKNEEVK